MRARRWRGTYREAGKREKSERTARDRENEPCRVNSYMRLSTVHTASTWRRAGRSIANCPQLAGSRGKGDRSYAPSHSLRRSLAGTAAFALPFRSRTKWFRVPLALISERVFLTWTDEHTARTFLTCLLFCSFSICTAALGRQDC